MNVRVRDPKQLSLPPVPMDWTLDFASGELKKASAYWKSCCGERTHPARADLIPKDMVRFLKHVMLVDVQHMWVTSRAYRVRLAGTSVEQVTDRSLAIKSTRFCRALFRIGGESALTLSQRPIGHCD